MYLKSLVLKGFKSFADRSALSLEPGITAVVGPNGSGKSNISDAVLWVLGERNAKNLRGQVMEDVIFAGSSARKSVGVAEVTLVLDNSDGSLPVDFDEVAITRRMYRNGESEYLINNVVSRRMDVLDILHDSGLGTGTHSIISQGHLDSILQSRPEDRRDLIEEAAGVLKHKQRKAKSMRKLEQMDQHLARAKDVVAEVERQLGPLQRKAKRAIAYQEVSGELAELDLQLAVDDLHRLQAEWDASKSVGGALDERISAAREQLSVVEGEAEQLAQQASAQSAEVSAHAAKASRLASYVDRIDSLSMVVSEKKRSAQARVSELSASMERNAERRNDALAQRGAAQQQMSEVTAQLLQERAAEDAAKADYERAHSARVDLERVANMHMNERREQERATEAARRDLARSQEALAAGNGRLAAANERLAHMEAQGALDDDACRVANQEQEAAEKLVAALGEREAQARDAMVAVRQQRDAARAATEEERAVLRNLQAEIAGIREVERAMTASAGEARVWAQSKSPLAAAGVSKLADSIRVSQRYESLVEHLLGDDVAALLVGSDSLAQQVSDAFSSQKPKGAFSMLLSGDRRGEAFEAPGERLLDSISADADAQGIVEALLGDVFVCRDFASALAAHRSCSAKVRFVTLEGDIVWPSGKITLGKASSTSDGALSRAARLKAAEVEESQARARLNEADAKRRDLEEAAKSAQEDALAVSQELAQAKGALRAASNAAATAAQRAKKAEGDCLAAQRQIQEIERSIAQTAPQVESFRLAVEQAQQKAETAKELAQQTQDAVIPAREREAELATALSEARLRVAKLVERETYTRRVLDQAQNTLNSLDKGDADARQQLARRRMVLDRVDPLLQTLRALGEAGAKRKTALAELIEKSEAQQAETAAAASNARAAAREQRAALDALLEQEGVKREERVRLEMRVKAAIDVITVDCATPLEQVVDMPALDNRLEMQDKADKLRRRIASMGVISPDAAEEYEKLKARYDYLHSQLEDLRQARLALAKIDRVIDERMRDDFARTFQVVNGYFGEIFAKLFPGGTAELQLVDPDDMEHTGVEVVAQPKGKKITKMMLMSGGEKSLVALALLFAVYRTRTTPFYILDEVEAALDDSNLRRLTAYLDDLRHATQLIMITHQRRTMEMADVLFGVSMQGDGVTKVISQRLEKALQYAE